MPGDAVFAMAKHSGEAWGRETLVVHEKSPTIVGLLIH